MKIAEFSIKYKSLTWLFILILLVGGLMSYDKLARLEDPEFTIKKAKIFLLYPGATAKEVEDEVTYPTENALQELSSVKHIYSTTFPGKVEIEFETLDQIRKDELVQVWDEVRKKLSDVRAEYPPGVSQAVILDDFGDVYGIFYALTGDGYNNRELKDYADVLKRELLMVDGVRKIIIGGEQKQKIYVDIDYSKLAALSLSSSGISRALQAQNLVVDAGDVDVADENIRFTVSGKYNSVEDVKNTILARTKSKLIFLKDIAEVKLEFDQDPSSILRFNGKEALTFGISVFTNKNILKMNELLNAKLKELEAVTPLGMTLTPIYHQAEVVDEAISAFVVSLMQAIIIVVVVLLLFMGLKSGAIIGFVLFITITGTFIVMDMYGISLQRISLGALIIALGMLVDNAIVVAEGMLIKIQSGVDKLKAANDVVKQSIWPLLGSTIIAIIAFAPIGLSKDKTGEYAGSLFWVILISLMMSWVLAVSVTPFLCSLLYKKKELKEGEVAKDPYDTPIFNKYKSFLTFVLRNTKGTVICLLLTMGLSIFGFKFVDRTFFPDSTTPMFFLDYWRQEGTDIKALERDAKEIEEYIMELDGVEQVITALGSGGIGRFALTYNPLTPSPAFGQFIVRVDNYEKIPELRLKVADYIKTSYPYSEYKHKVLSNGPATDAKIEARISGNNEDVLRELSEKVQAIMRSNPNSVSVKDDWRQKVKTINFDFSEEKARLTGISRKDIKLLLKEYFKGSTAGVYRDGVRLIPIVVRAKEQYRDDVANVTNLQVFSTIFQRYVPIEELISNIDIKYEQNIVKRRDRKKTITPSCDALDGNSNALFVELKNEIEKLELPPGYSISWGGEHEASSDGQSAVFGSLPLGVFLMFLICVALFRTLGHAFTIWLCVPLAIVGITFGLLVTNLSFGFMALLGLLSLSGMLIKNAIVLLDQIELERSEGKQPFKAIVEAAVSRVRPVSMAAFTTALGMIPLLFDPFFQSMAAAIIFGLAFATVFTLIVIPLFYKMIFKVSEVK